MKQKIARRGSIDFKAGQAHNLFDYWLDTVANDSDISTATMTSKPIMMGPEVENEYTKQFKTIVKAALESQPMSFSVYEGKYLVKIGRTDYDVRDILKYMQREQIQLSDSQLNQYDAFLATDESTRKPTTAGTGAITTGQALKAQPTVPPELSRLHSGEIAAINIYTQNYYTKMNKFLRGGIPIPDSEADFQKKMKELILHNAACISGLNKGRPIQIPVGYRYDDSNYLPEDVLNQRIQCAESKGAHTKVMDDQAFISSAEAKPAESFDASIRTVFYGVMGFDISSISAIPEEREVLMPPAKIKYLTHFSETNAGVTKHYFLAVPVMAPKTSMAFRQLQRGGTYLEVQHIIKDTEKELVLQFLDYTKAAMSSYLKDQGKVNFLNVTGRKKANYASQMLSTISRLQDEILKGESTHRSAYNTMFACLTQLDDRGGYLDVHARMFKKTKGRFTLSLDAIQAEIADHFNKLSHFKSKVDDYFSDTEDFFEDSKNKQVIQKVYEDFLSRPYNEDHRSLDPFTSDWTLDCDKAEPLPRPNHGLAHTLRGVAILPEVFYLYTKNATDQSTREVCEKLSKDDIKKMQLAMLFSVVGRGSELGHADNLDIYRQYRQASADAFEACVTDKYQDLFTANEIQAWKHLVQDFGNPGFVSTGEVPDSRTQRIMAKIMRQCHCLDLLRCYNQDQFNEKVTNPLAMDLGSGVAAELIAYSEGLITKTGDRLLSQGRHYNYPQMWAMNRDVQACMNTLIAAQPSSPHKRYAKEYQAEFPVPQRPTSENMSSPRPGSP